jgi:hypothetical protein
MISTPPKPPTKKTLDRIADEVAQLAARTEQRFDQDNDIFTK